MSTTEIDLRYAEAWELLYWIVILFAMSFMLSVYLDNTRKDVRQLENRVQQLEKSR